ncbi:hypothetical protein MLD38_031086 [Melastoma candidum]|uniref:Uncharacterized protein n=1 Tax=Melastoma candidum TaxID=119954 RepID=A0ACB9MQ69_9MYRT|nr:hypothetical protein MLD38_031086 [Melastoma candidum]
MSERFLFLNHNPIPSHLLPRYLSFSKNDLIPFILSFVAASLTLFLHLPVPKHRCRRRKEAEIKEGAACCPDTRCAVCLDDMFCDDGENRASAVPGCNHRFHEECFEKWLEYSPTCPVCRFPVKRGGREGWLHCLWRYLLACFLRWMDKHFDTELAIAFCNDS